MADPLHHFIPLPDATVELRRAFGRFGTGVTIVTVQTANGPLGMTANSFSSVSLDPPLVQWSPALSSKRHDAFTNAAQFAVHILGSGQRALADAFAVSGDAFDQFDWTVGPNGAPTLAGSPASTVTPTACIRRVTIPLFSGRSRTPLMTQTTALRA